MAVLQNKVSKLKLISFQLVNFGLLVMPCFVPAYTLSPAHPIYQEEKKPDQLAIFHLYPPPFLSSRNLILPSLGVGLRSLLADVGPSEETPTLRNQPQEGNQGRTMVERDALGLG